MSQTTDSFEDRMSDKPLEYFGEPLNQFPEPTILTDEGNRATDMPSYFEEPENVQVRATQTATTTTIRLQPNLWRDPQEANIQRATGENPTPQGGGRSGGGGGGGGSSGGGRNGGRGGGGGGNPPPSPAAGGHAGGGDNKLFGQPPDVFTGDRSKTKEFLTQWELYQNLNHLSNVMGVPYS